MRNVAVAVLALFAGEMLHAQYYEPEEDAATRFGGGYFSAGISFLNFKPRPSNPAPDSLAVSFNQAMPMIGYSEGMVDVMVGYTRYSDGGNTRSSIILATTATTELLIIGRRGNGVSLPLCVAGDFTKAESAGAEKDHFNMASIGAGTGVIIRAGLGAVDASLSLVTTLQWAFDAYGSRNGSSSAVIGNATVYWRTAPVFKGLAFGYRFRYQSWSISDPRLDYASTFHGPYIGAMF